MKKSVVGMSKAALARKAKVSRVTVDTWISKGCPSTRDRTGRHCFTWQAVQRWRKANLLLRSATPPSIGSESYTEARTRKEVALAGLRELQLQQKHGSLADIALLRRGLEGVIVYQRTILLSLPAQIGREIDEPELRARVQQLVDRRVREALEAIARYDPVLEPGDDLTGARDAVDRATHQQALKKGDRHGTRQ